MDVWLGERQVGIIDEASVYNRALAPYEIEIIHLAGGAGKCRDNKILPVIVLQPTSRTVAAGDTTTFNVMAVGTKPLRYQWRVDEADLSGATAPSITFSNVQPAQAANYSVIVSNAAG